MILLPALDPGRVTIRRPARRASHSSISSKTSSSNLDISLNLPSEYRIKYSATHMPVADSKIGPTVVTAPASIMESDDMRTRDHHSSRCLAVSALPILRTFVTPRISAQSRLFHACLVIKCGSALNGSDWHLHCTW